MKIKVINPNTTLDMTEGIGEAARSVARDGTEPEWAVTQIRIINRAIRGPYAAGVAC